MRRYLQGTLDYNCAIYAVINALSLLHSIGLEQARSIFKNTLQEVSRHEVLWDTFLSNNTDFYWLVRYLLENYCSSGLFPCACIQPFSDVLAPREDMLGKKILDPKEKAYLHSLDLYSSLGLSMFNNKESARVWDALFSWLNAGEQKRVALFRFHRFIPMHPLPVISHWTSAYKMSADELFLFDASAEEGAVHSIQREDCFSSLFSKARLVIPECSVVLLEAR